MHVTRIAVRRGHPLVARAARRDPQLQVVSGHGQRAVLERQRRGGRVPTCESRKRVGQPSPMLADAPRALADDGPGTLSAHRRRGRSRPIRIRKHVEVRQRRRSRYAASCSKSSSVSPGKPTMMSEPIDGVGHPRADVVDERRVLLDGVGPAHGREHAVARVLQRQMKVRREAVAARRPDRRSRREQSIGSSELMRNSTSRARDRTRRADAARRAARSSSTSDDGRRQVAAVRAEMHAGQRDLLEAGGGDALDLAQHVLESARCAARRASSG